MSTPLQLTALLCYIYGMSKARKVWTEEELARLREKPFLTTDEAGAVLGFNTATVRRLLVEGKLPGGKVGDKWRVSLRALERMMSGEGRGGDADE